MNTDKLEYLNKYNSVKKGLRKLRDKKPELMKNFGQLHRSSMKENVLSTKNKELIALGISISIRCQECILFHLKDAIKAGASDDEILETVEVSVLMGGGPSLMYASHVVEALEEVRGVTTLNKEK